MHWQNLTARLGEEGRTMPGRGAFWIPRTSEGIFGEQAWGGMSLGGVGPGRRPGRNRSYHWKASQSVRNGALEVCPELGKTVCQDVQGGPVLIYGRGPACLRPG